MIKRTLLIVLLGISLTALIGNEASARVCVMRSTTGACLVYTGSIECWVGATGLGNALNDNVFLGCTVSGTDTMWAAACGNPGSSTWTSPGINLVLFDGNLDNTYQLKEGDVNKNGNAYVTVTASPGPGLLQEMTEKGACPNTNWSVIDAVPCDMTLRDVQLDANYCVTSDAYYSCTLPNCGTLQWDVTTQKFERRQYECTQLSTHTYKIPVNCPP